jgi:hypothetical protein
MELTHNTKCHNETLISTGGKKMNLEELDDWLKSEDGQSSLQKVIDEMEIEEELATKLENKSTLVYKDGQKVMLGDVFIDEYHEQLEDSIYSYGATSYVYRINEDNTIDNCLSSCFAWKANNYKFDSERSRLVRRNGKLQNPIYDSVMIE